MYQPSELEIARALRAMDEADQCELSYKKGLTARGFQRNTFLDRSQVECEISESSLATTPAIRLGVASDDVTFMTKDGWETRPLREMLPGVDTPLVHTTMHLTQAQVRSLVPILQTFAKTGELVIPDNEEEITYAKTA